MKNYFEQLKKAMEIDQEDYDIEPAFPIVEGIVWPPRNLEDVKNNCEIWRSYEFYDPDAIESKSSNVQKNEVKSFERLKRYLK
ncbi:hypothetical protein R9W25_000107 [Klebsiella variicola]|nr:hypothetical protein [Klebsiella variicola]